MENKFFEFAQNNSGGHFDVDDNVCHRIIIEAKDVAEALEIRAPMLLNQTRSCPCCGDRWSDYTDEVEIDRFKTEGRKVTVYNHYAEPESLWVKKYGSYEVLEKPEWRNRYGSEIFEGKIAFRSIDEYCQFMADEYPWTVPDVRLFLKDGTIKEFYTREYE